MTNTPSAPLELTLAALQKHIHDLCEARGWADNSAEQKFLLLVEEVGEVANAIRRATKLQIRTDKPKETEAQVLANLGEELVDMVMYVMDIANHFNVDMEASYRAKIEAVSKRTWS